MTTARPTGILSLLLLGIVQLPSGGIQQPNKAGLTDAPPEERVGGESSECVIADLGVGRRGAAMNEGEVFVRGHDACV